MQKNARDPQLLLADYQIALVALMSSEAAMHEAERTESELLAQLQQVGGGTYLQPGLMDENVKNDISLASVDAHIKKVQASQLKALSQEELKMLGDKAQKMYSKKKVKVVVVNKKINPIESVWQNKHTGAYRYGSMNKAAISGTIEEVILQNNILVVKPTWKASLLMPELKYYFVHVLDMGTMEPNIELSF